MILVNPDGSRESPTNVHVHTVGTKWLILRFRQLFARLFATFVVSSASIGVFGMAGVSQSAKSVRFGTYELDLRSTQLKKHGLRLKLQRQPAQILVLLVSQPGEVVTREQLRSYL